MNIAHYKKTGIANSPEAISNIINKYTDHESKVFGYGENYPNSKTNRLQDFGKPVDVIHLHNKNTFHDSKLPRLIQYHSEPFRVNLDVAITKVVIAQYHATLPEYQDCIIVRNPIDIWEKINIPKYYDKKIKIGYSPSTKTDKGWYNKGYKQTTNILQNLKEKYKEKIDIDIIYGVDYVQCKNRKSLCNIVIDEVMTGSYHRSGLEGLSLGCLTICKISDEVDKVMKNISGSDRHPFLSCSIKELEYTLTDLIENKTIEDIIKKGVESREWMKKYWNPIDIAEEYIKIYKNL